QRLYYLETGTAPNSQAMRDAIGVLESRARFDGPELAVYTRLAECNGAIYLDLVDSQWRAGEKTSEGWKPLADPPRKVRRAKGMRPLPVPEPGGSIIELRRFINIESEDDWVLLVAYLVGSLRPRGPFPIAALHGQQGSAKSTTARTIRDLVDPNTSALR